MTDLPKSNLSSGIAWMLLAMFCVASNDAVGKHLTQDYSVWQVLWIRSWIWLAVAFAWVSRRGGIRAALRSQRPGLQAARSAVLVLEVSVFIFAFKWLPLGDVSAIAAATPLVVIVFAVLFLGERVGPHRVTAVIVGMIGVLLIARPGGALGWLALLPIAGVLLWGIYQVLVRLVSRVDSAETSLLWSGIAMFAVSGCIAPFFWVTPVDAATWFWFVVVGLLNTTGHFALIVALGKAEASALQPYSYTQVVWAIALGWLVFGEWPDALMLLGTALVVCGGLYAAVRERRRLRAAMPG